MAAALAALANARNYAARQEAAALTHNDAEQSLLAEIAKLRDDLAEEKRQRSAERDALRDQLAKSQARLTQVEEEKLTKTKLSHKRLRQTERLLARLKRAESEVATSKFKLGQTKAELAEARRQHEREKIVHESQLLALRSEVSTLSRARDELITHINAPTSKNDCLQIRTGFLNQIAVAKRAHQEVLADSERVRRRLRTEQDRRITAEKRIDQLLKADEAHKRATQSDNHGSAIFTLPCIGQYQQHAATVGYDTAADSLFNLMRRDVIVADQYDDWQANHMQRVAARRRDLEQTLDEQAYAAAMAMRWRLIDHPHIRLGTIPKWFILNCLLDEKSEKYLLMITTERINEMQNRVGAVV